ncbi:MAG: acyl-CoA dehydrogenase family protein [Planctomycetes bacterium]|nr:acyl-CoA dehydrogenase family protein [Planctomycetota bacterium]
MPNFFSDNEDIVDYFENMNLHQIVQLQERGFRDADGYDYAPVDYEDTIDSYRRVLELVGDLAANFIEPRAEQVDREEAQLIDGEVHYAQGTQEALDQFAKADLMGFTLPREYGGLNLPVLLYTMAIESVSRADASLMNLFGLQDIAETIESFADEEIKEHYLPKFASGEVTGAMVLTEPDAGSDLTNIQLKATYDEEDDCWYLDGVKRFITNGCAEVLLVLARSEPDKSGARGLSLFVCDGDETVQVRRIEEKLGIHGSPTCELQFNHTPAQLIGKRKRGLSTYVMALMNGARLGIAAQGIGIAQAALSEALEYAATREQFGQPIRNFPAVRQMLGDMHMKVETARLLSYETSRIVDLLQNIDELKETGELEDLPNGDELKSDYRFYRRLASALTPLVKYYATEICNEVCYDSLQVLGGSGYMQDYDVERYYRDARITTIYEGTTQIQFNAAIGYITRGFLEERFQQLHEDNSGAPEEMLDELKQAREWLQEAVDYVNEQDDDFRDLNSGRLCESATFIYNGYLLLEPAMRSEHKMALAKNYFSDVLAEVKHRRDQILRGDRTYLDEMPALLGYE